MTKYANTLFGNTPQTESRFGKKQVKNYAGGYVYEADKWTVLDRFLIIGSESNTYYAKQQDLTKEQATNVLSLIAEDGHRVVDKIVEISDAGRAVKNNTAIFALALCSSFGDNETRKYAFSNLNKVARTVTHLFQFVDDVNKMRGWGRGLRNAIANWYTTKDFNTLAYQVMKYKNREGWSHKDVLTMSHAKAANDDQNFIFKTLVKGFSNDDMNSLDVNKMKYIIGMNFQSFITKSDGTLDIDKAIEYIKEYNFPREVLPTALLSNTNVWSAMLNSGMPMTAMLRNLGNMSKIGLLTPFSESEKKVIDTMSDSAYVKKSRIHPLSVLMAMLVYKNGMGIKGTGTWDVNPRIITALEDMFYNSFSNIEPTGFRYLNALDISGSMHSPISAYPYIDSMTAMSAMSMSLVKSEANVLTGVFTTKFKLTDIDKNMKLTELVNKFKQYAYQMGGTDIASSINYLIKNNIPVDVIFIGSDGETWAGDRHVDEALSDYRNKFGLNTRLIVANTEVNMWSLTESSDNLSYNIAGFDSNLPTLVREMSLGNI
jgi:60 kDa SS-A/Ro ribonucleoprotein